MTDVETPVYLYDTLGPLGDDSDGESPSSSGHTIRDSRAPSQTDVSTSTSTITELHSRNTSSTAGVQKEVTEEFLETVVVVPPLHIDEPAHEVGSSDYLEDDLETKFDETVDTRSEVETPCAPPAENIKDEEFDFLSLVVDDLGDTQAVEQEEAIPDTRNAESLDPPPWARTGRPHDSWFRSPFLQLHQEIVDFCNFVSPTEEEQQLRAAAVKRVSDVVKSIWPSCQVKVFGSFATGLFLPTSDCDVVILDSGCSVPQDGLKAIAKALHRRSLVKKLQVIGKARVPIVKFVETGSNISFDISFDVGNGPDAAEFIKDAMTALPPLKPLCLVLKIFLQQRELNEVYTGGIGSYALLVMLLTHLQVHPSRRNINSRGDPCPLESNLGILLVDFFDFYGRALNVRDIGISCRNGGRFFTKPSRGFYDSHRPYLLSVEDPQSPDNDIGKNSFNVTKVRSAFLLAHRLLTKLEVDDVPTHIGLLGRIVRMDKELIKRKSILPEFPQRLNSTVKLTSRAPSFGYLSPMAVYSEVEPYVPGTSGQSRWEHYEEEDFPRGGVERDQKPPGKRKHARDKSDRAQRDGNSYYNPKSKSKEKDFFLELENSPSGRGRRSRYEMNPVSPTPVESPSVNPSSRLEPGSSDTLAENSDYQKLGRRGVNSHEDNVGRGTPDGKRNRWRKQSILKDSEIEGDITTNHDARFSFSHDQPEEQPGTGNGHNKHKKWFNEGRLQKSSRGRADHGDWIMPKEDEDVSQSTRRVVVTKPAHKKIKYG